METYALRLSCGGRGQSIPIEVIDLDDDLEPRWPLVFDHRLDTLTDLFQTPGFKEASEMAIKDWFYFFRHREFDEVPVGAETASLPGTDWKNHETIANDRPFRGFWVFKRTHRGPYATGFPNHAGVGGNRHTHDGVEVPGRLPRSGSVILHDNPEADWNVSPLGDAWHRTNPWKVADVYGLTMHEFGHAIVFHTFLPGFEAYSEHPELARNVVAYQGHPVPHVGSGHLGPEGVSVDRLSGHSGGHGGVFPPRRWMLTKLVLLVAAEVWWDLRGIGPFVEPAITTDALSNATWGQPYREVLASNQGGVPVYDWNLAGGALPRGLKLDRFTGEISGRPTAPRGIYRFTVKLKDDDPRSSPVTKDLSIRVTGP